MEELARVYLAEAPRPGLEHQRCLLLLEATTALAARQDTDALLALEEEHGHPAELAAGLMVELERADSRDAALRRLELQESLAEYHHSRHQYAEAYDSRRVAASSATATDFITTGRFAPGSSWAGRSTGASPSTPSKRLRIGLAASWRAPLAGGPGTLGDNARTTIITRWLLAEATHDGDTDEALAHCGVQRSLLTWGLPTAIGTATSPRRWLSC